MLLPAIQQRLRQWLQPSRTSAIAYAVIIGLVAALAAVFLKFSSGWLGAWRVQSSVLQPPWLVLPLIGGSFGFLSGLLIQRLAPEAGGSGIPDVKASLANFPIKLSWRIGLVKLASASLALGSGLSLGRQGPTVHIGAALAGGLSRYLPMSPDHRRQLIAAGAGAGLAAAFNAPITGVLFVVEQLLQDLSGITLGTAIIASFVGAVVSRLLGGRSLQLNLELTANVTSFSLGEIPFYIILGILAGLLGSLFNQGIITSLKLYQRLHISLPLRIALAGSVSGIAVSLLPHEFHDNTGLREFMLTGEARPYVAAIAFVAQFLLTVVAAGSGAPGGVFAPSLIMGSALGYLVGVVEYNLTGMSPPITYALAGMGAFFSVVSKVPLTAIAIVFEMTTDFNLVLPLMIGSVTSYLIAEKIAPGSLYDKLLAINGINLDSAPNQGLLTTLTAENVMQPRVETLGVQMTLDEAVQAFSRSHHRGFPVVDEGKLVGIVTQTDLAKMRDRALPGDTHLSEIMTPSPITVSPSASLSDVLYFLDHYKLSRLPVIEQRKLIGIITRADIIRAEADKLNGEHRQVGPQPEPSYTVYQTRSPAVGQGRMLVPLANPHTANALLQFALAIARDRHYELECVHIILVSRNSSPAETAVNTAESRRLLRQAEAEARKFNIPLHTQIRVAHDPASAILEIITERHIDLVLMGWKGKTITPGRIFGSVADTLIRQASCEVVLVKFAQESNENVYFSLPTKRKLAAPLPYCLLPNTQLNRWLVPVAGGPNSQTAIQLLPSLLTLSASPSVHFCQVVIPNKSLPNLQVLEQARRSLVRQRHFKSPVTAAPLKANSVIEGIIEQVKSEKFDVVVLGASREGLLQQTINGNIPVKIALEVDCTAILVRSAVSGNG
ncbi:chloride channel protein [Chlorogloea sp. CCALA 695]|uniref:chloride channel protein n=1 Tax=Chlorogloea sp. CCALA 695 TaxID=2107693 RepID=UPI000D0576F7|nr:chloride channel protein [Chlorogloea sp. CCALA 695]PSB32231.1 chloride channel protein [Chlorogloea sp. CCALA 695]